jgi:peptidoglycan hydrolase FlgJ
LNTDVRTLSPIASIGEAQFSLSQAPQLRPQAGDGQPADLTKAAHEFEAYFISNLLKVMRETVPKGGALENKGGAYFYSFYDQEIGRLASEAGGIGLVRMIHEYTEKSSRSLKFSESGADTVVDKNRPTFEGLPE